MRQEDILNKLKSLQSADEEQLANIRTELVNAALDTYGTEETQCGRDVLVDLIEHMISQVPAFNSSILSRLFPFFAAICGDRDAEEQFATIDWDEYLGNGDEVEFSSTHTRLRFDSAHIAR